MTYRVIQWGTGNVGRHALRTIIERPDFELAGVRVYDPSKVGKDAGELVGSDPVGVVATDDTEAILSIDADCVCYTPLGTTLDDYTQPLDDICRLLASGKNVVSSAVEYFGYLRPGIAPGRMPPGAIERINAACTEGGTSFYEGGINPGFAMDLWPLTLSRVCRRIDHMRVTEVVDMKAATSAQIMRDYIGFGTKPDHVTPLERQMSVVEDSAFHLSAMMIAEGMGIELDEVSYRREVGLADEELQTALGIIEPGAIAALKMVLEGIRDGRVLLTLEYVWRMSDEVAPEWPSGESRWILDVEGDPQVRSELVLSTDQDAGRAVSLAVATLNLNAVPAVCAARPGPIDNLTIPPHAGGYFAP